MKKTKCKVCQKRYVTYKKEQMCLTCMFLEKSLERAFESLKKSAKNLKVKLEIKWKLTKLK